MMHGETGKSRGEGETNCTGRMAGMRTFQERRLRETIHRREKDTWGRRGNTITGRGVKAPTQKQTTIQKKKKMGSPGKYLVKPFLRKACKWGVVLVGRT